MSSVKSEQMMEKEDNEKEESSSANIRVKQIKEINLEFADSSPSSTSNTNNNKRKLPDWLQSMETDSITDITNKKIKTETSPVANNLTTDELNDNDTKHGVTVDKTDQNDSLNNNNVVKGSSPTPNCSLSDTNENKNKDSCIKIKVEVQDDQEVDSSSKSDTKSDDDPPTIKTEATSTTRDSCKYGIRCYRRNPVHRLEEAHPGDSDYRRPIFPSPPKGTPDCPFGDKCYRRNPSHFQKYSHPPATDFNKNWKIRQMVLRKRKQTNYAENESDDYDLSDPFIDDNTEDEYEIEDDEDSDSDC